MENHQRSQTHVALYFFLILQIITDVLCFKHLSENIILLAFALTLKLSLDLDMFV